MPKLTLTFDTDTERNAAEIAVKSMSYALAWNELREWVRDQVKYQNNEALALVRAKMAEINSDRNLPEVE